MRLVAAYHDTPVELDFARRFSFAPRQIAPGVRLHGVSATIRGVEIGLSGRGSIRGTEIDLSGKGIDQRHRDRTRRHKDRSAASRSISAAQRSISGAGIHQRHKETDQQPGDSPLSHCPCTRPYSHPHPRHAVCNPRTSRSSSHATGNAGPSSSGSPGTKVRSASSCNILPRSTSYGRSWAVHISGWRNARTRR